MNTNTSFASSRPPSQTLLITGGKVHVMDGVTPPAEAIVLKNGRVAGVGSSEEMKNLAGSAAEPLDIHGCSVMPGLIDTHPHLLHFGALSYPLANLADAQSHEDIVQQIQKKASETPAGEWVMATPVGEAHYFIRRSYRDLKERNLPQKKVLDRATTQHPVLIQAWAPVIPNVCALNSLGLRTLGITRETPDRVENVWIEKDANGEPTGILHGSVNLYYTNDSFIDSLWKQIPFLNPESIFPGTRGAMAEYNRIGVTTVYEGHMMSPAEIEIYRTLRENDELTVRVLTALESEIYGLPWALPLSDEEFEENLKLALSMTNTNDDFLRSNGVTISRGGPCWPGFLRMHESYPGPYEKPTRGFTFVSGEKEARAIEFCARNKLRLNCINTGYRDHDEFLDRAETLLAGLSEASRGWILQHVYLLKQEHARRYARLRFHATTSMSFSWGKGDLMRKRFGNDILQDLIPLRRLLDAGLVVGCGTDWGPKNIFEHIQLAQTHRFCGSGTCNLGPAQPVTRMEAALMWTRDAARVLDWENIGTLRPSDYADLIITDRDPLTCDLDDLPQTKVVRTFLGGRTVYDDGTLP
ncbi:MAG: hypothetical protein C4520_14285 [Candidatus Abyssobacteria bacterium SURF_5]|uniref:Amidohydrolase 3 domain-containing protein n=1 Tax=Abyssobacteria bacterium (strain SURF_5) TaxID=2093360 RepID=A0A3A4NB28_ABYX5|nr:MAG: hypothetical protein C4520_14285 [Candidatus Abyssubacteria bacterium SURF_5]